MAIKKEKNLVSSRSEYTSYYGDFRGVDFSSDHTQVRENRLAYSLNMYKDYRSKNGTAIETIPGFRRQFQAPGGAEIYAMHNMKRDDGDVMLVHAGNRLYKWENYPYTCNTVLTARVRLRKPYQNTFTISLKADIVGNFGKDACFVSVTLPDGTVESAFKDPTHYTFGSTTLSEGDYVTVEYCESKPTEVKIYDPTLATDNTVTLEMNAKKSNSFVIGETLFIMDGKNFLEVTMENETPVCVSVVDGRKGYIDKESMIRGFFGRNYVPTRYIGVKIVGENANGGEEYEQRNLCCKYFKIEYTDKQSMTFPLKEKNVKANGLFILSSPYGEFYPSSEYPEDGETKEKNYWSYDSKTNEITLTWGIDQMAENILDGETTLTILAEYTDESVDVARKIVEKSEISSIFDNRVFISGNREINAKLVHYSKPFSSPTDPIFFGEDDRSIVGMGSTDPITALMPVANTLMVLGSGDGNKGSISFLTPVQTGDDVVAKAYTEEHGLFGTGCVGAYANFYDDPVFLSKRGLDAIGTLSTRLERAVEHRSSLVDAYLANVNLDNAFIAEWGGYLLVFVDGSVYMADSRQRYTDALGIVQYEWYYLEGIGVYDDQKPDKDGVMQCGKFKPASCAYSTGDDLYFGTKNGVVCKFNFDKRDEYGEIPINFYTFDGRTIKSGCATKMDNCGIPHLTKSTVKKSLVIKTKTLGGSVIKVKVRTNRDPFNQVTRIASTTFSFEDLDFEDLSFETGESSVFAVKEKQKKWIEKQLYLYSDEHMRPFALYYIAYRYFIAGRYKET